MMRVRLALVGQVRRVIEQYVAAAEPSAAKWRGEVGCGDRHEVVVVVWR